MRSHRSALGQLALLLCTATSLMLPACSGSDESAPDEHAIVPRYQPDATDFFRMPWPSDSRTLPDGHVDLHDFPDVSSPYLAAVRTVVENEIVGFSTMPVGYIELDRDPGSTALPTPQETLDSGAPLALLAVDSEHCGQHVPVEVQISQQEAKHLRPRVLEIAPVPGFVLRQASAYAFVVTKDFGAAAGLHTTRPDGWDGLLDGSATGALSDSLEPLRSCAASGGIDLSSVAIATVFTTQDVLGPALALRDAARDATQTDAPTISGWANDAKYSAAGYRSFTATYDTPIFQDGVSPYANEGGGIHFDDQGRPIVQRYETVPMIVTIPDGAGPFPVLLWVDGTGWTQWGHVNGSLTQDLLTAGFAVASYMPQFHGDRATPGASPELHTYNFNNPEAGRNVIRQQIADTSYFIRVLKDALPQLSSPPPLDTSHLVFGGQSQGAQNGALLASVEPDVYAYVLNGLASYLTITILERKDAADYEALLKAVLGIYGEIDRFYPALQILQLGADSVDGQNYAVGWEGWSGRPDSASLFVLNGYHDFTTAPVGIDSVTIAGDLAPIDPPGWDVDPAGVWERSPEPLPIDGNRTSFSGDPLTLATYLDPDTTHFTIYDRPQWRARAVDFLVQALDGLPAVRP